MQFSNIIQVLIGLLAATTTLATPIAEVSSEALQTRDTVKLNQYRSVDDCNNDRNILYHAAPVSGHCYTLDGATGAYFLNRGGYFNCKRYYGNDCTGDSYNFGSASAICHDINEGSRRAVSIKCS